MNSIGRKRNGEIALFKFLFALMVFVHHFYIRRFAVESPNHFNFLLGHIAVEFFFIVSGYLMTKKAISAERKDYKRSTFQFLIKKIKRFFPFVAVVYIFSLVLYVLQNGFSWGQFIYSLPNLFMITMTGVSYLKMPGMGPLWYISAMLIGMLFLYPLIQKCKKKIFLIAPIIITLVYGYMILKHGGVLSDINSCAFKIIRCGVLRAIGGMSIGIMVFLASERLSKVKFSRLERIILTMVEYICLLIPFFYAALSKNSYDILMTILIAIGVLLAFSGQSLAERYFQNKFVFFLESISLFIYLFHDAIIHWINYLFGLNMNFYLRMVTALIITLVVAETIIGGINVLNKNKRRKSHNA